MRGHGDSDLIALSRYRHPVPATSPPTCAGRAMSETWVGAPLWTRSRGIGVARPGVSRLWLEPKATGAGAGRVLLKRISVKSEHQLKGLNEDIVIDTLLDATPRESVTASELTDG